MNSRNIEISVAKKDCFNRAVTWVRYSRPLFIIYLSLFFAFHSCVGPRVGEGPVPEKEEERAAGITEIPPLVRVLVKKAQRSVKVGTDGGVSIRGGFYRVILESYTGGGTFIFRANEGRVAVYRGNKYITENTVVSIFPAGGGRVYLGGYPYRGGFQFRVLGNRVITINIVGVDDYIKGVLPSEIGYLADDQYQAYRAQAIAARTYALSKLKDKKNQMFDLTATVMDQVYTGMRGENPTSSNAVDETRGMVCFWNGEPIKAYYCACCGGHTADIRVGWFWKEWYPYLFGIRDTVMGYEAKSLCRKNRHFRWNEKWSGKELERMFKKTLPAELGVERSKIGRLKDIRIGSYARSGRVKELMIVTDRESFTVRGDRIRWVLMRDVDSGTILRSTLFKMKVIKKNGLVSALHIRGGGNGHGVGMCQAGAIRMAELGYSAEEILLHYYPGATIGYYYQ
jgi:stage II sporulation protein D